MTDIQMEGTALKKKLMVPVVVLMLCAVTLVGAGYAYTTTVTNTATVDAEYYAIEMFNDDANKTITTAALSMDPIELSAAKSVQTGKVTVTAATSTDTICYIGVYLNSDTLATDPNVTMSAQASGSGWNFANNVATHSGYNITVTLAMGEVSNGYIPVTLTTSAISTEITSTDAKAAVKLVDSAIGGLTFTLTFTCTDSA